MNIKITGRLYPLWCSFALELIHSWDLKTWQWHKTALFVTSCGNKLHFVPHTKLKYGFYVTFIVLILPFWNLTVLSSPFVVCQNTARTYKLDYKKKISFWVPLKKVSHTVFYNNTRVSKWWENSHLWEFTSLKWTRKKTSAHYISDFTHQILQKHIQMSNLSCHNI